MALTVAKALSIPAPTAAPLLDEVPFVVPRALTATETAALLSTLRQYGAPSQLDRSVPPPHHRCQVHPKIDAEDECAECKAPVCFVCKSAARGRSLCPSCEGKSRRSRLFFRIRVAALLMVLACVLGYAWRDMRKRHARKDWDAAVDVGIVLLRADRVDPEAILTLSREAHRLEDRLAEEFERYRPGHTRPFRFALHGPIDVQEAPPRPTPGWIGTVRFSLQLWWYLHRINARLDLDPSAEDVIVYVLAHRPATEERETIEGISQQDGRVGLVEVELDSSMAGFAMFVTAHELLHTLGATDKYDSMGNALLPTGLGDPDRTPRFPQVSAEIMARNVVVGPGRERPPSGVDELRVGSLTAHEIGWREH